MSALDTERKLRELSFVRDVAQLASSTLDWDEMLRIVIDRTTDAMRAEVASLYLLERHDGVLRLVATNGLDRRGIGRATLRIGEGISGWVANARVPLAVRDVRNEPRFKWVAGLDKDRFTSMLSVPLVIRDEVVGVMNVQTVEPREFDKREIDFLSTIADQLAGVIEKSRLQRDAERKLREVSALFEVSNVLTSTLELDEVLSLVVDRLVRVYAGSSGAILLTEGGTTRERARAGKLTAAAEHAARTAVQETRPVIGSDHLALPLLAAERLLGAVVLQMPRPSEFHEEEVAFVGALANQAALAIDKASLYELERKAAEDLRAVERARAEFVAVVTHDLRTPLSVIRGYLELLAERDGSANGVAEATAQVERVDRLVDGILASVRAERTGIPVRRARFDLRAVVAAALHEVSPVTRRHRVTPPRAARPLWVRGDRRRTIEVIAGLVHNATKYAPERTRIGVRVAREGDGAVVRVADQGPGVAPRDRERLFAPFMRVGDTTGAPGAGIGLYAARLAVEAQGGAIWYEDAPGGGGVFAFSLPRVS